MKSDSSYFEETEPEQIAIFERNFCLDMIAWVREKKNVKMVKKNKNVISAIFEKFTFALSL